MTKPERTGSSFRRALLSLVGFLAVLRLVRFAYHLYLIPPGLRWQALGGSFDLYVMFLGQAWQGLNQDVQMWIIALGVPLTLMAGQAVAGKAANKSRVLAGVVLFAMLGLYLLGARLALRLGSDPRHVASIWTIPAALLLWAFYSPLMVVFGVWGLFSHQIPAGLFLIAIGIMPALFVGRALGATAVRLIIIVIAV